MNNDPIPFANVIIDGTTKGTTTDVEGNYIISDLEPGTYNINVSYLGFKPFNAYEIMVTNIKATYLNISLEESAQNIKEIVVRASPFNKTMESPLSMRSINATEIYRNPGGGRDISKVIQSLPGVGRKTANVVLGNIYGIPSLVVDTHVTRISNLLQRLMIVDIIKL